MSEEISEATIIAQTQNWIHRVVVGLNFCPFARREMLQNTVRYRVLTEKVEKPEILAALEEEYQILDNQADIATSFLILPFGWDDFDSFWPVVQSADKKIQRSARRGRYQLANFHPAYIFADSTADDAANFTNRSPYPMLHILREKELTKAIKIYPDTRLVPANNIGLAREKGLAYMRDLRESCFVVDAL